MQERIFGNALNFDDTASQDEWMRRINEVDKARNQTLKALNEFLKRSDVVHPLTKIDLSFTNQEIERVRSQSNQRADASAN